MSKKKTAIILIILSTLMITTFVFGSEFIEKVNYNIKFGPNDAQMQYPIYESEDRVYVSIRDMCDNLGIPIEWDEENREINVDMYNKKAPVSDETEYKEEGVIPDEETALAVGKTILEKYIGEPVEYETDDKIYYLDVEFLEQYNAWRMVQYFDFKNGGGWSLTGENVEPLNISISKSTGEVLYLGGDSSLYDIF